MATTANNLQGGSIDLQGSSPVLQSTVSPNTASPNTPISTAQPNPATVQVTPAAQAAAAPPPQNLAEAAKIPAGQPGSPYTSPTAQSALAATQASGPAPQTAGEAAPKVQAAMAPVNQAAQQAQAQSAIQTQLKNDPGYQQLLADSQNISNITAQQVSLLDTYKQMETDAGLPALNTQLLNTQKIINGTEDDIRNEVQAANGFATNSQVLALSSARNKTLIQNYNNLLATKAQAESHITTMLNLVGQDRANALAAANSQFQIDSQLQDYKQKFIANAQAAYKNVIDAVGYQGLYQSLQNDPNALSLAEQTLGFASGQLQQVVQAKQAQDNLKNLANYTVTTPYVILASGQVQNSQTGEAYSNPQDFQSKTGMTLDQAGQKGLIKALGKTTDQAQQEFDNTIKLKGLQVSQYNAQTSRISANQPTSSVVDTGNGKVVVTIDKAGNIINQQPVSAGSSGQSELSQAQSQNQISLISDTIDKLKTPSSVGVGANSLTRNLLTNPFSSKKADFIAGVRQLTTQLTKDSLIQAKAAGATFGALSEGELKLLSDSASKISSWEIKNKQGEVIGYNTSASSLKSELDRISNMAKLDYVLKGGDAASVGVKIEADGTATTLGSDGKIYQIYP